MADVAKTKTSLPAHQLQGEPPTAKAARAFVKRLDKPDLNPVEQKVHSLVRRGKYERLFFEENLLYGLYMEQRSANKLIGRPDTPEAMVGPDQFSRTNLGEELIARQGQALGDTPPTKVTMLRILLHPEESAKLLASFESGLEGCMLELKRQLKWDFAPLKFKVIGRGDGRMSDGAHNPELLAEMQAFNKLKREVLIETGVIKPKAIAAPKQQ